MTLLLELLIIYLLLKIYFDLKLEYYEKKHPLPVIEADLSQPILFIEQVDELPKKGENGQTCFCKKDGKLYVWED